MRKLLSKIENKKRKEMQIRKTQRRSYVKRLKIMDAFGKVARK